MESRIDGWWLHYNRNLVTGDVAFANSTAELHTTVNTTVLSFVYRLRLALIEVCWNAGMAHCAEYDWMPLQYSWIPNNIRRATLSTKADPPAASISSSTRRTQIGRCVRCVGKVVDE